MVSNLMDIRSLKRRLNSLSAQQRARRKFGNTVVDRTINLVHKENSNLQFDECDAIVENVWNTVLILQECVDTYIEHEEQSKKGSIVIPSFEKAREQICKVGKDMEAKDCEIFELLTCDVPLFRTVAKIYTQEKENGSKV